jgi:hypothetical protein
MILLHDAGVLPFLETAHQSWQLSLSGAAARGRLQRRLGPELVVSLVQSEGGVLRHLTAGDAAKLMYGEAQLFDRAFANLYHRRSAPLVEVVPGLYAATGGAFTATRLVLPTLLRGLSLRGDPVAFIPQRQQLFVTGSEDTAGLLAAAARVEQTENLLTCLPLRLTDDGWSAWLPAVDHPAHAALAQLAHAQLSTELDAGSAMLSSLLPQCAQPTIGTRESSDGARREVVVALDDAREVLVPRADEVRTPEGATLSWSEFSAQHTLQQVEGANGAWFRFARA